MIDVSIKVDDKITPELKRLQRQLTALPQDGLDKFVSLTPVRSGNARRSTRLRGNDTIVADYPYAERLDNGYSKQAPKGMSKPFDDWFKKKLKQIFGK
jgi:hypothetical protein